MKKPLIVIAILAVLAAVWFFVIKKTGFNFNFLKKQAEPGKPQPVTMQATTTTGNAIQPTAQTLVKDARGFPLSYGSRGSYVKNLQDGLNRNYGANLSADGIWGPKTDKALKIAGFTDYVYYKQYNEITRSGSSGSFAPSVTDFS